MKNLMKFYKAGNSRDAVKGGEVCFSAAEGRIPGTLHHKGWNLPNNGQGQGHQRRTSPQGRTAAKVLLRFAALLWRVGAVLIGS